jgi:hypothetical protein
MLSKPKSRYKLSAKWRAITHNCGKGITQIRQAFSLKVALLSNNDEAKLISIQVAEHQT